MAVRQLRTGPIGEMGSPVRREWFRSLWESRVLVSLTNLQDLRKYPLLSFFHAPNWTLKTSIIILIARKVPINALIVEVESGAKPGRALDCITMSAPRPE